jgi:hypothetical protein
MDRENYGGVNALVWILGAILAGAAIYWLFSGFAL